MTTHVIQIGRQRFVCGLFWQSLSRRHELRKEAIELAKKLNFDLMVLRIEHGVAAAGFANVREGAQAGLASLGVIVAKTIALQGAFYDGRQQSAPNWLGAFSLPDNRWAYFAVRDGSFLPNGDWIGSADEVFERLNSDYGLGGWNTVIGDPEIESMGFHNFYPRRIADLLESRHGRLSVPRWTRLRPVKTTVSWPVLGFAVSLGVAAIGGSMWYSHYRAVQDAERARALALARARLKLRPPSAVAHPWASIAVPDAFAHACQQHFTELAPGGWALDRYVCATKGVDYRWSRNGSTAALLLARAPDAQFDSTGEHASLNEPADMGAARDEDLLPGREVRTLLFTRSQMLNVPLTLAPIPGGAPQGALAPVGSSAPAVPPWNQWRLQAKFGGLPPEQFVSMLNAAGVRVVKLTYQAGEWSAEGVVYAN